MADEFDRIVVGDDVSDLKIYEIINRCFGKNYRAWMRAWYDIDDDFAVWFPKIYPKYGKRPNGDYGGLKNWKNTLSFDEKLIESVDYDRVESPEDKIIGLSSFETMMNNKKRLVFGRVDGKFRFLGVFNCFRVWGKEHPTYRNRRLATGIDLKTFKLIGVEKRFDPILNLEDTLKTDSYGKFEIDLNHAGTMEDPIPFPMPDYSDSVIKFIDAVHFVYNSNPEYCLEFFGDVVNRYGYANNMLNTDVSEMDDKCLVSWMMLMISMERFSDGLMLEAFESGIALKWIARLRELSVELEKQGIIL